MYAVMYDDNLRVYNRTEIGRKVKVDAKVKAKLREIGFEWDNRNHSYRIPHASMEQIASTRAMMDVDRR